jgi:predicted transcriptional regulator of viral defense system
MDQSVRKKMVDIFKKNNGYARTKILKTSGIHSRQISCAIKEGVIIQIKRGMFKLASFPWDHNSSFVEISKVSPQSVICLLSALSYYDLSTVNPEEVYIAFPARSYIIRIDRPPTRIFYFSGKLFTEGITNIKSKTGEFKIYSREKTVCDVFRFRNRLGEDVAIEGLRNYLRSKQCNINELLRVAYVCRVKSIMTPYIKGMVQ